MQWDQEFAHRLVCAEAAKKLPAFAAFPEHERDDLVQIGLMAAWEAWPGYDADRSSPSTFITTCALREMLDTLRARMRKGRTETKAVLEQSIANGMRGPVLIEREDLSDVGDERDLATWLKQVYMAAKDRYATRGGANRLRREGRKFVKPAQAIAAVLLMGRLKLNTLQAARLFELRLELCRAIRFLHPPPQQWFASALGVVPAKYRNFDRLKERWDKKQAATGEGQGEGESGESVTSDTLAA